jgi:LysM repeat protein
MNRVTLSQGVLLGNAIQIVNASSSAPLNAQDVVVSYDANGNRVATASGSIQISAAQGVQLGYDAAGNRRTATSYQGGALATDSYTYDGNNRLVSTSRGGSLTSSRTYDWAGRVTEMITYSGAWAGDNRLPQEGVSPTQGTVISERRVNTYNNKSWLLQQDIYNGAGTLTQRASYTNTSVAIDPSGAFAPGGSVVTVKSSDDGTGGGNGYDRLGNLLQYQVSVYTGTAYTNTYRYSYLKYDTYRESQIAGSSTYFQPGATTTTYDANGAPVSVTETFATNKNRSFVVGGQGHILAKTENGNTQRYFYVNEMQVGTSGALGPADFGQSAGFAPGAKSDGAMGERTNGAGSAAALTAASFDSSYVPISDLYPAATPGRYVVSQGDTLRSIALSVFGDAQLWYVIADANGLQSDADLRVGQTLTIPNRVTSVHNNYSTFKVYNPGEIIGDTTPTLPAPPPPPQHKGACGGFGAILVAIVSVIVAIVLPVAFPAIFGPAAGLFGTVATAVASNLAGQVTANIVGLQHGINFASIAVSALSAGITFGIVGGTGPVGSASAPTALGNAIGPVGRAIVGNVVNQGVGILLGQQHSFSWASVAGAAVSAAVTQTLSGNPLGSSGESAAAQPASAATTAIATFVGGMAGGLTRAVLSGGRINFAQIAADSFGNALGTYIGMSIAENIGQQQAALRQAQEDAKPEPVPLPQPRPAEAPQPGMANIWEDLELDPDRWGELNEPGEDLEPRRVAAREEDSRTDESPRLTAREARQMFSTAWARLAWAVQNTAGDWADQTQRERFMELRQEALDKMSWVLERVSADPDLRAQLFSEGKEWFDKGGIAQRQYWTLMNGTIGIIANNSLDPESTTALAASMTAMHSKQAVMGYLLAVLAEPETVNHVVDHFANSSLAETDGVNNWYFARSRDVASMLLSGIVSGGFWLGPALARAASTGYSWISSRFADRRPAWSQREALEPIPRIYSLPWGRGIKAQGMPFEDWLESSGRLRAADGWIRLPKGTAGYDFFNVNTNEAVSAKTLFRSSDYGYYSGMNRNIAALERATDEIELFGRTYTVTARSLLVGVPENISQAAQAQIDRSLANSFLLRGNSLPVEVIRRP